MLNHIKDLLEFLKTYADSFGVIFGIIAIVGAVIGWNYKRRESESLRKEANSAKEQQLNDAKRIEKSIYELSDTIYSDTRKAIVEIFREIVSTLTSKIEELRVFLSKLVAMADQISNDIEVEKQLVPRFSEKIDRLQREFESLQSARLEATSKISSIEADRQAAEEIASDMLSDRWAFAVLDAQYARLQKILAGIEGGPAVRAAQESAKASRLAEGKIYAEFQEKLTRESKQEGIRTLQVPLDRGGEKGSNVGGQGSHPPKTRN